MTLSPAALSRALPSLPFAEYAAHPGVNASLLKAVSESPLHGLAYTQGVGAEDTYSRQSLRAVHCLALEGERAFLAAFHVLPPGMTRRGSAWEAHKAFAAQTGRVCLTANEAELVTARARAVRRHAVAGRWLADRRRLVERMVVWVDKETGLVCKGRPDLVVIDWQARHLIVADLKTWKSTRARQVSTQIGQQKAHLQLAHYVAGVIAALTAAGVDMDGWTTEAVVIVVEDAPPHDVGVYTLSDPPEEGEEPEPGNRAGEKARRDALTRWAAALESGSYPGRCPDVERAILPRWADGAEEEIGVTIQWEEGLDNA